MFRSIRVGSVDNKAVQESSNAHTNDNSFPWYLENIPKKELQNLIPGHTTYCIDQDRLHASEYGEGKDL